VVNVNEYKAPWRRGWDEEPTAREEKLRFLDQHRRHNNTYAVCVKVPRLSLPAEVIERARELQSADPEADLADEMGFADFLYNARPHPPTFDWAWTGRSNGWIEIRAIKGYPCGDLRGAMTGSDDEEVDRTFRSVWDFDLTVEYAVREAIDWVMARKLVPGEGHSPPCIALVDPSECDHCDGDGFLFNVKRVIRCRRCNRFTSDDAALDAILAAHTKGWADGFPAYLNAEALAKQILVAAAHGKPCTKTLREIKDYLHKQALDYLHKQAMEAR